MATFLVSKKHIDYLITVFKKENRENGGVSVWWNGRWHYFMEHSLDEWGQILWQQNMDAVNTHYNTNETIGERLGSDVDVVYMYQPYYGEINPLKTIKACDFWRYQVAEGAGYEDTFAWAVVDSIREESISNLPGYDDYPWEIIN